MRHAITTLCCQCKHIGWSELREEKVSGVTLTTQGDMVNVRSSRTAAFQHHNRNPYR